MNKARIRQLMDEKGISISDLAEMSDTSESTIKRLRNGSTPHPYTAAQIAKALDTTVEWLSEPEEDAPAPPELVVNPATDPIIPIVEPDLSQVNNENKDVAAMQTALDHLKTSDDDRFADLKEAYKDRIRALCQDKIVLGISTAALVIFLLALFIYDIATPTSGWFRC
jgi:transcriptional regulator with XRE-family HTH domain